MYPYWCKRILFTILFCNWWLRSHRQGPLEWLWKKATWIKVGKG
ncbi:DUF418 domain-containing protein [Bacteroides thetaiotaomicron]|nr:DUF418 domain-containing protein [Bacteroides thetaiotaomicron]MCS3211358.1 DUF418 domain-containing protein [Bacteroides thetaiotaomicron]